jgi:hypothetical protein
MKTQLSKPARSKGQEVGSYLYLTFRFARFASLLTCRSRAVEGKVYACTLGLFAYF